MYVSINGKLSEKDALCISPFSQGLRYGYGIFETLKILNDKVFYFQEHWERMHDGCRILNLSLDKKAATVERDCYALARANRTTSGVLRMLYFQNFARNDLLITTEPLPYTPERYARGFHLCTADTPRAFNTPLRSIKTSNYLENLLAREAAKKRGYDEALFLNTRGEISEGTVSNIFFVIEEEIFTPSMGCGILPGIMRSKTLEMIRDLGLPLHLGLYSKELLDRSEEIFLTNSLLGIMPVSKFNHKALDLMCNRQTKRLTAELQERESVLPECI